MVNYVAGAVNDVSGHGTTGRHSPGATAIQHHLSTLRAADKYGIEDPANRRQWMVSGKQSGMHPQLKLVVIPFADSQQLDDIIHPAGIVQVSRGHRRYTLAIDLLDWDPGAKGYGRQKGHSELYRGAEYQIDFLPKVRIELAIEDDQLDQALEAIQESARTDTIGDGKIFVWDLEHAVRIRTGERGEDAL